MLRKMYLVTAEDYRPSPILLREDANAPTPLAAVNDHKSSTHTLSGLSCALNISKLNYGVMHGLRKSPII